MATTTGLITDPAGAPDLIIEISSPSTTTLDMNEREAICLANGAGQFWLVDPNLKIVEVSTPDGKTVTCREAEPIDLSEFGGGNLSVAEIFSNPAGPTSAL